MRKLSSITASHSTLCITFVQLINGKGDSVICYDLKKRSEVLLAFVCFPAGSDEVVKNKGSKCAYKITNIFFFFQACLLLLSEKKELPTNLRVNQLSLKNLFEVK